MAYLTMQDAVARSRTTFRTKSLAETSIRKSAASPASSVFDIFLSHAHEDTEAIAGVKALLESEGLSVYVDWIDDARPSREQVTTATADMLRQRMNNCRFLLFATSSASSSSKWMPWELGYFDGRRRGRVGILPIVRSHGQGFSGQEYLGLYPTWELVDFVHVGRKVGRHTGPSEGETLAEVVRRA